MTDDPVRDAEENVNRGHDRPHITCSDCGCELYAETSMYYADEYYLLDGKVYCEDCALYWLQRQKRNVVI